ELGGEGDLGTGGNTDGDPGSGGAVGAVGSGGLAAGGNLGAGGFGAGGAAAGGTPGAGGMDATGGSDGTGGHSGSCDASIRSASVQGGFAHSVTGGQGGNIVTASTGTQIHAAICNRATDNTPLVIMVNGTITPGNTTKQSGSCNTADGVIELKE